MSTRPMADDIRPLHEARALLLQFTLSDLKAAHVATDRIEFFASRDPEYSARSRVAGVSRAAAAGTAAEPKETASAPHLGTLGEIAELGATVDEGDVVATLTVLDRTTEIRSQSAGVVAHHHAEAGSLVEFGQRILTIA